ncbi:MAG TPA: hypothetical protein VFG53_19840 [Anaeromyxobacter sp.]|nr:hypothetical protein [Anaeromyxobacter sp.]
MTKTMLAFTTAVALLAPAATVADRIAPSHFCSSHKPKRSILRSGEWDLPFGKTLRQAIGEYRDCLRDFAREQEGQAKVHQEAADQAVQEWNSYVNCMENHKADPLGLGPDC